MKPYDARRDFSGDARLLQIGAMAALIGMLSTGTAWLLLKATSLFTNLFFSSPCPLRRSRRLPMPWGPRYSWSR